MNEKAVPVINYSDDGTGKCIVLLHGFLESDDIWNDYVDKLSEHYRVICVDLPGHGLSSVLADEHSMDMMAEEVYNILEILGVRKILLVGHSMGGYVSCAFAAKYPELLKGLVLLHSQAADDSDEEKLNRDRTIEIVEKDKASFIAQFTPSLFAPANLEKFQKEVDALKAIALDTPKEGILAALRGMKSRRNHVETIKELKIPVMVIAGDQDSRIPLEKIKGQFGSSPHIRLEVIKGCGHMGFVEASAQVLQLIQEMAQKAFKK